MDNLLVPVDLSEISKTIISRAACIASHCSSKIWLLHVLPPDLGSIPFNVQRKVIRYETAKELHHQRHQLLALAQELLEVDLRVRYYHKTGDIGKTILGEARRIDADLIVMGTHGHGNFYHTLFGGVGQKVSRLAACPVMKVGMRDIRPCEFWMEKLRKVTHSRIRSRAGVS